MVLKPTGLRTAGFLRHQRLRRLQHLFAGELIAVDAVLKSARSPKEHAQKAKAISTTAAITG